VLADDLKLVILMIVMLVCFLFLNRQYYRLARSATDLSKFAGMVPQEILLVLRDPSLDQNIIWILVDVSEYSTLLLDSYRIQSIVNTKLPQGFYR
jgi:hypothetical protein